MKFILKDKKPIPCSDILEWGKWFENSKNRLVAQTELPGKILISTVFLGIDHNFLSLGRPVLFETMIFADYGWDHRYCERYCTWEEAELGHQKAIEWAKENAKTN